MPGRDLVNHSSDLHSVQDQKSLMNFVKKMCIGNTDVLQRHITTSHRLVSASYMLIQAPLRLLCGGFPHWDNDEVRVVRAITH